MLTWVDTAYTIHNDMKYHTGCTISFVRGVIMSKSTNKNLHTKKLIKLEAVNASDYLPCVIWMEIFLKH